METVLAIAGITLALGGSAALITVLLRFGLLPPKFTARRTYMVMGIEWAIAALVVLWVVTVEGRPLASAGIRWSGPSVVTNPLVAFFTIAGLLLAGLLLQFGLERLGVTRPDEAAVFLSTLPVPTKLALAVTAGVTEEFLYRGYLMERTIDLTGSAVLAVVLSVVAFSAAHLPWRSVRSAAPGAFIIGITFAVTYILTRSLPIVIFLHAALDAIIILTNEPEELLNHVDTESIDERVRAAVDAE